MNNPPNITVLLYTYDRLDDTRINQEVIKNLWSKHPGLANTNIVHTYNGQPDNWQQYLEDHLLLTDNPGHFMGAVTMLNQGHQYICDNLPETDYVIILAADTWLTKPDFVHRLISTMQSEQKYLATCAWGTRKRTNIWSIGMSLDFCIYDLAWAKETGFMPLRYQEFLDRYEDVLLYEDKMIYPERVLSVQYRQAIKKNPGLPTENLLRTVANQHLLRITEREPIHKHRGWFKKQQYRQMQWPKLGLLGDHHPGPKQAYLTRYFPEGFGPHSQKLIQANDLSYYNLGKQETYLA